MMDEALIDGTEAEMLVVSLEETPCEAEVADTLTAVEEADGISVSPVVETEGESLSDSVVVAESGGEVVLVSGVVVAVEVESGAESVSDSEVAESGGEAEVITGVVVVVDAVSGVVVAVEVESGAESVSDSEVAESGGEAEVITGVVVVVDATLDGSSVLIIEDDVVSGIEEVESVDEALAGALDIGDDGEANVVVSDDEAVSDVDTENGVENELAKTFEAEPED
jgi:hypothetical protein